MIRLITTVAVSLALSACGKPSTADYQTIHKDGLTKISYSSDLEAHYQQVDHFITHFGFGKQPIAGALMNLAPDVAQDQPSIFPKP